MIKKYASRLFGIDEAELHKAFIMQLILFFIITTLLLLKPTISSLFLTELSADALPIAYILTGIFAVIGSHYYTIGLEKFTLNTIIERSLVGVIAVLMFFAIAFNFEFTPNVLLYASYIFIMLYGLLLTSQFWLMANIVYNVREAKRVFGFIGSGGIAGGIFGGYLTSVLSKFMPAYNILFVAAFLVLCCIPLFKYIWNQEIKIKGSARHVETIEKTHLGIKPSKLIKNSKLLMLITLVTGLSVLIAKLIDYQYSDFALKQMGSAEKLSAFFGIWLSNISIISLIIQLFLTERILKYFGVGSALLLMPTGILIGSVLLLFIPELWVVVFIKVVDGSLKQSINKSAKELIFMPIPFEVKKKTKTFIDVVVDSLATGLAGIILFFFVTALNISSIYVSLISIALIICWIILIFRLKKAYTEEFRARAEPPTLHFKKSTEPKEEVPLTSIDATVDWIFKNGEEQQILYMLRRTYEHKDERFFNPLKGLLSHESAEVRKLAIKNLYYLQKENLSKKMELMAEDKDPEVAVEAVRYLLISFKDDKIELIKNYLNSTNQSLRNATLVALSVEYRNNSRLQRKFNLEGYVKEFVEEWHYMDEGIDKDDKLKSIIRAIGYARIKYYYKLLNEELQNRDDEILKIALRSASRTRDHQFIDSIVSHLSNKRLRISTMKALFRYGDDIIPILKGKVFRGIKNFHDSIFIPEAISQFKNQKAVNALIQLAENGDYEISVASIAELVKLKPNKSLRISNEFMYRNVEQECNHHVDNIAIIYSLKLLNNQTDTTMPDYQKEMEARNGLLNLVRQRFFKPTYRLMALLELKYDPEDIEPMHIVLNSGNETQGISAVEFLDNLFDNRLRRLIVPLAEADLIGMDNIEEIMTTLKLKKLSEYECLKKLLDRGDTRLAHATLYLIEQSKDLKYKELVESKLKDYHYKVQKRAKDILEQFRVAELRN